MKSKNLQRCLALLLLLTMAFTLALGSSGLAYAYPSYSSSGCYPYYNPYYWDSNDDSGFISVYPVGGYYGYENYYRSSYYYGGYTYPGYYHYGSLYGDNREYLGGANVPRGLRRNVVVNDRDMGWTVLGRSLDSEGETGIISATSRNNLDFVESLGRAEDDSLCLLINVVGSAVAADSQQVLGLYGRIGGLEKMKTEGIEAIAITNAEGSLRMTYNISEVIKYAKAAYKEKGASASNDPLLLSTMPVENKIPADVGEQMGKQYSSEVFLVTDSGTRGVEISSLMSESNVHIMVRADASKSRLVGVLGEDVYQAGAGTVIQRSSFYGVTGYLPIGSAFGAISK